MPVDPIDNNATEYGEPDANEPLARRAARLEGRGPLDNKTGGVPLWEVNGGDWGRDTADGGNGYRVNHQHMEEADNGDA